MPFSKNILQVTVLKLVTLSFIPKLRMKIARYGRERKRVKQRFSRVYLRESVFSTCYVRYGHDVVTAVSDRFRFR